MTSPWTPLDQELALWRDNGRAAALWWRDDDAVEPSPALDRLLALTAERGIPLGLAVIPAAATRALADRLAPLDGVRPLPHGWTHGNHEPADRKKAEFGSARPLADRESDARAGLERLRRLFGARVAPVFVPPWNRFAPDLPEALRALGYRALSAFGQREGGSGLPRFDTHVDVIDWRGSRSLVEPEDLIAGFVALLRAARLEGGDLGREERPIGLLTHHLVHDEAIWSFLDALTDRLEKSGAVTWVTP